VSSAGDGPLTDSLWVEATKHLKLPEEARAHVEHQIVRYREFVLRWSKPAGEVGKSLKRVGAAAKKFADLLEALTEQEAIELIELRPSGPHHQKLRDLIVQIRGLSGACAGAAGQISPSRTTARLDDFIKELDAILHSFTGRRVSRAKAAKLFLAAVCRIADEEIGIGAVEEAIKRLQACGEIPKKTLAKATADSRR
jgi:hypothetical protein